MYLSLLVGFLHLKHRLSFVVQEFQLRAEEFHPVTKEKTSEIDRLIVVQTDDHEG